MKGLISCPNRRGPVRAAMAILSLTGKFVRGTHLSRQRSSPKPEIGVTNAILSAAAAGLSSPQTAKSQLRPADRLVEAYREVRAETEQRAAHLSAEDQLVQSMPDA